MPSKSSIFTPLSILFRPHQKPVRSARKVRPVFGGGAGYRSLYRQLVSYSTHFTLRCQSLNLFRKWTNSRSKIRPFQSDVEPIGFPAFVNRM